MVSPLDKNGHSVYAGNEPYGVTGQAAEDGNAVSYVGNGAFPGALTGPFVGEYVGLRGSDSWTTEAPFPPQTFSYGVGVVFPSFLLFSPNLSKAVLLDGTDSPPLVPGEQETGGTTRAGNLFLRDNATGAYSLINFPAPGLTPAPYKPTFDGASEDLSTIFFDAPAALTPEAPGGSGGSVDNLYEWRAGRIGLLSQIPPVGQTSCGPGGPACIPAPNGGNFGTENVIESSFGDPVGTPIRYVSSDGSRAFFTAAGHLYVRENGDATVQVDTPQGGSGPGGGGEWATAAGDGSRVFFYDDASAGLTADTVPGSGTNLYSFDTQTGALTNLTPEAEPGVMGVVNEASQDGSYLYFAANAVLTTAPNSLGEAASPGDCLPEHAALGGCEQENRVQSTNLYLFHAGSVSFIHRLSGDAALHAYTKRGGLDGHNASRLTPDGRHLAFFTERSGAEEDVLLPVYKELFEYSAETGEVTHLCACNGSEFRQQHAENLPYNQLYQIFRYNHSLSDDGSRLFLEVHQPLLARDTNHHADVYQFELDGTGGCHTAPGCLSLISSGTSAESSYFVDASASGNDVFFNTGQQLVSSDTDHNFDLYDARVEGGFPQPPPTAPCLGDACLPAPTAINDPTPASSTYVGPGNEHPTAPARKHHKKHRKHRRANTNRRAGK